MKCLNCGKELVIIYLTYLCLAGYARQWRAHYVQRLSEGIVAGPECLTSCFGGALRGIGALFGGIGGPPRNDISYAAYNYQKKSKNRDNNISVGLLSRGIGLIYSRICQSFIARVSLFLFFALCF